MKKYCADGQIVLSNKRLKNLVKVLKIGDYIPISVIRKLEHGRYRIKLQGTELVGVFRGVLPSESMFYAVIQAVSPHVVLKLIANDSSIQCRVDSLSKVMKATHGSYSLQPFMGDIVASFMKHGEELRDILSGNKKLDFLVERFDASIVRPIDDALSSEITLAATDISVSAVLSRLHKRLTDIKQSLDDLCNDNDMCSDLSAHALLCEMSKECDDLVLQIILQQSAQLRIPHGQAFEYYQIPARIAGKIASLEIYLFQPENEDKKGFDVWIHADSSCIFAKGSLDLHAKNIKLVKLMYPKNEIEAFDNFLERIKDESAKNGWHLETDVFLTGTGGGTARFPVRPHAINIRTIQHFTIVA